MDKGGVRDCAKQAGFLATFLDFFPAPLAPPPLAPGNSLLSPAVRANLFECTARALGTQPATYAESASSSRLSSSSSPSPCPVSWRDESGGGGEGGQAQEPRTGRILFLLSCALRSPFCPLG